MSDKQKTLNAPVSFKGKGLHTGVEAVMTVKPAEADKGIVFKRIDLEGQPEVPALSDYVTDTSRGTTIEDGAAKVCTVEHIMSALWSMGVDNALIEIDGPEIPILDGSSGEYAEAIKKTGLKEQEAYRKYYEVREKMEFRFPDKNAMIALYPDSDYGVSLHVDYDSRIIGNQYAIYEAGADFAEEIAPCRTFVFLHEIEQLLRANLIKGGDLDNAIVVVEKEDAQEDVERLSKLFDKKDIKVSNGYVNNLQLKFTNEIARHKLLDVLGDFALLGMRIKGRIFAMRPGHFVNTEAVKELKKAIKRDANRPALVYDAKAAPVYDINRIRQTLPHRPPFLLVDRIFHIDSESVGGIKNVTMNEPFFTGHFPEEPVMPGVLIIEAMAQCGGILALHDKEDPENYSTYFLKIDNVRFKQKVVPGDTLQFELRLTEPIRRGIVMMEAKAFVGGALATEAFLMAQVTKNKV
jgi:UDP-3-O-[3-hydroxymyristoyl] N-acetylglucosamine deacetylase/3-hydroxyacyl-[acyl-carrier-protein] dehydratase